MAIHHKARQGCSHFFQTHRDVCKLSTTEFAFWQALNGRSSKSPEQIGFWAATGEMILGFSITLLYFVWSPPSHLYIFLLANLLAFYLTYLLAFYLANLLAFYLAYLLAFYLTYLLAFYLAFYLAYLLAYILTYLLAFYLAFYLAYLLAFYLAYLLAFYLPVGVQQCTLSWEGRRLRSSCTLSWADPRLRSSGAHWAETVPGWGPCAHWAGKLAKSLAKRVGKELGEELARRKWRWKLMQTWSRRN